jgi:FKBP-type peptidyl-prolyl cis-trans isomerase FklB
MGSLRATPLLVVLLAAVAAADEAPDLTDAANRASYSLGFQIGSDLGRDASAVDADAALRGLLDGLEDAAPALAPEEMNALLVGLNKRVVAAQRQEKRQQTERYRGEGRRFLEENARREGVVSLPSGVQYEVLAQGSGRRPGPTDRVRVHYRGTLIDGSEFGRSDREQDVPEAFHVNGVIPGLGEALQQMPEGSRWRVFIPPDLAYGERGPLADRTVIYDVELLAVEPAS